MWLKVIEELDCCPLNKCLVKYHRDIEGSVSIRGYAMMIDWHYCLWHDVTYYSAIRGCFWTCANFVCGVYEKLMYVKKKEVNEKKGNYVNHNNLMDWASTSSICLGR